MVEISKVEVLNNGYVELIDILGDEKRIADVARISYGKTTGNNNESLIKHLLNNGHLSPFEQVQFTFKIKCPIFVARQWMRHRTGKYNEKSRRYTKKKWDYYIPNIREKDKEKIINAMSAQIELYEELLESKIKPEIARTIMGVGFNTEFYFTIDLRNLLHFLELRTEEHSQYEIRMYANTIENIVKQYFPNVIQYWRNNL